MPPPRGITAARPPFLPLRLDASARLGGVLGRLGGVWGASWGVLGRQKTISKTKLMLRAKMSGPQSSPKLKRAQEKLFLGAKMQPKPLQDAFETALVLHPIFNALFLRSWLDFPSQLGSQKPPKSKKNRCKDAFPS